MISILMPIYNVENYVKESIESILNNSYKNFELIIVNDGSNDNSIDIIKQFSDSRIKLFQKENSGLVETLNYGIQKCNSSIIMRMDGDDVIHNEKIERQLKPFKKSKSILMGTLGYLIDSKGRIKGNIDLPLDQKTIIKSMLKISAGFIHPSVMFYKDAVLKVGGYNYNFTHAEDFDLFLRLSKIGKISNIEERLIYIRKHEKNVSLLNAEKQIKNTIISKDIYKINNDHLVKKSTYMKYKQRVETNFFIKLYIKIHLIIVQAGSKNFKSSSFFLQLLKVFRRILKILIS